MSHTPASRMPGKSIMLLTRRVLPKSGYKQTIVLYGKVSPTTAYEVIRLPKGDPLGAFRMHLAEYVPQTGTAILYGAAPTFATLDQVIQKIKELKNV